MTWALDLLTCIAWWGMVFAFAVVASVLTLAVFWHAFPNGDDDDA